MFKHVTLRGKIGRLMVTPLIGSGRNTPEQEAFDHDRASYYENVDWALYISAADAVELEITGIPAPLIRRDPETQIVVTRQAALSGQWRELEHVKGTELDIAIQELLQGMYGTEDIVLVAHRRSRNFNKLLAGIQELRAAGIAQPD